MKVKKGAEMNTNNSFIFNLPDNFEKKYKTILRDQSSYFYHIERRTYAIILPNGLTKQELENNIKDSLNTFLADKGNISAVMVFVYRDTDRERDVYTIARGTFAPYGDWSKASEFISYENNKLVIDYQDNYFEKEDDPRKLMNIGDTITLAKKVFLSSLPDNDDNIVFKTISNVDAQIINKIVYPMGSSDLIRYMVKIDDVTGWVGSWEIYDEEAQNKWEKEKKSPLVKEYFVDIYESEITNQILDLGIKTNFPDGTMLLISLDRHYYIDGLSEPRVGDIYSKDLPVKDGDIKVQIVIDDNKWYSEKLRLSKNVPSVFSQPKDVPDKLELRVLFSPMREQSKEILEILGTNGEFIKGHGAEGFYGKTKFDVHMSLDYSFNVSKVNLK